jgi:hypothetical protein
MGFADGSVEQIATVERDSGLDQLKTAGSDLYVLGLEDVSAISLPLRRIVPGGEPVAVADVGAVSFSEDSAYYTTTVGLVKTPLDFSVTSTISGTGVDLTAVTVGAEHVWYAARGCIYRIPK